MTAIATLAHTPDWMAEAACHDVELDVFYDSSRANEAKGICAGCPVSANCLTAAIHDGDWDGFRGSMTGKERADWAKTHGIPKHGTTTGYTKDGCRCQTCRDVMAEVKRESVVRRAGCGTDAGYATHRREGTEPCSACRAAHAAYNRYAACKDCNSGKTSVPPDAPLVDDVASDALRWSRAIQAAAEIQRDRVTELDIMCDQLREWWLDTWVGSDDTYPLVVEGSWHWPDNPDRNYDWGIEVGDKVVDLFDDETEAYEAVEQRRVAAAPPMPRDWRVAARAWFAAGIRDRDYVLLMEQVRDDRGYIPRDSKWKYFAGCIWNVIRERQQIAREMLTANEDET